MASYFVDGNTGSAGGAGTSGDPLDTIQHGIDALVTAGLGTDGDVIPIRNTATYTENTLDFTGVTPSETQPVSLVGITTGDVIDLSAKAVISCGASAFWFSSGYSGLRICNLDITANSGVLIVQGSNFNGIFGCKIVAVSAQAMYCNGVSWDVRGNHLESSGGQETILVTGANNDFSENWIHNTGTVDAAIGISASDENAIKRNIIICTSTSAAGIASSSNRTIIEQNTILATGANTKGGIVITGGNNHVILANYIEGFSGAGGDAIDISSGIALKLYGRNAYFNCTNTPSLNTTTAPVDLGDVGTTTASGIDKIGTLATFADRLTYFAPTSELQGLGGFHADRFAVGAIQQAAAPFFVRSSNSLLTR